ncbi:hypothetical protein [Lactiplantibacillus plantarum]
MDNAIDAAQSIPDKKVQARLQEYYVVIARLHI